MAAYASLLSLGHNLDRILQHPPRQRVVLDKAQIDSLLEDITFLQEFLEDFSLMRWEEIQTLEENIARSAYAAEHIIERRVVDQILEDSRAANESSSTLFCQDLQNVIEEFDSVMKDVIRIKETEGIKIVEQPRKASRAGSSTRGAPDGKNTMGMVGFDEDLIQIMETLTGHQSNLRFISIVAMGGIGKTTLARNVYHNPLIVQHFHLHAWATISQEYSVTEILSALLKGIGIEKIAQVTDEKLGEQLYKILCGRKYLIVMDDMWSTEVWDDIKRFFPDNNNGSRIMVTTRLSNVADKFRSSTRHGLHFLDEDRSWGLFCDKVFGEESCPTELEEVGKTIVGNCKGLPLAIVAISGLLANSSRAVEYWKHVADDTNAALHMGGDGHCYEILSLSYKHLPVHLKPCFLSMAIFQEDCVIRVSKLVKLWVAEGILKPMRDKTLEEIAEDNLKDLIDRNLIMIHEYGSRNKIKTCTIHDLIGDLCLREAQKEKFHQVTLWHSTSMGRAYEKGWFQRFIRRISNKVGWFQPFIRRISNKVGWFQPFIRRISNKAGWFQRFIQLTSNKVERQQKVSAFRSLGCKLNWKIGDLVGLLNNNICSYEELVRLVSSTCIDEVVYFRIGSNNTFELLALLWNLQNVTIHYFLGIGMPMRLPAEIWEMPQLRHLKVTGGGFHLPDPPCSNGRQQDIIVLNNMQTLCNIINFKCADDVVVRIPNLKKLGITYNSLLRVYFGQHDHEVPNLSLFRNLESLFLESNEYTVLRNPYLPHSLKKLSLKRCRMRWEDLAEVGSLPHLEVLNLRAWAVSGREWNPVQGQFLELKCLRIEDNDLETWVADSSHFPRLEKLVLVFLNGLKEIPYGIGQIQTLRSISLYGCRDSAKKSAKILQGEQQSLGNYDLSLTLKYWDPNKWI